MTTRTFSTSNPPECPVFTHLRNGTKTVEGRPYSKKYHAVKAGDVIAFRHGSSVYRAKVKSVKWYQTLQGYLRGESLRKTLPGVHSTQQAVKIYNKWSSLAQRNRLKNKFGYSMLAIRV
jgi:ASC-1-like (ASCH) protein